jgi:hypothetical protein
MVNAYWMNLILQVKCGRDKVIDTGSTIAMRGQGKRHPLPLERDLVDSILVDNDAQTIIIGMLLESLL